MINKIEIGPVIDMPIESLVPYSKNPFELYTGQQLDDLVESIQANGVLVPVIVRPVDNGFCEILSGHNRVEASKVAQLKTVPVIVREGLSEDEALLIVIETNLIQRSFSDFSHSERAATIAIHHDAIKNQGRRTDLIREVEIMLDAGADDGSGTFRPPGERWDSAKRVGYNQGLSSRTVSRYLCVNRLIPPHKKRLDSGAISMRTAVSLSYLSDFEQELVGEVLTACHCRLSLAEAGALRAAKRPLTVESVHGIIKDPNCANQQATAIAFRLSPEILALYFTPEQTAEEIESVIMLALDKYFSV